MPRELGEVLEREDRRHLNTSSDSEVLLNVLASELQRVGTPRVTPADIFAAVSAVYRRCRGGYAVVAMVIGHGLLGFRDPNGIRPLVLGQRETPKGAEWMLASESVALDMLGFKLVRDVAPGEVVLHRRARPPALTQVCVATTRHAPCIFEYVYFARPDSLIDNISVHRARMRMGERLADKILRERADHDIDVVIPIPDTSRTSAMQVAQQPRRQVSRRLRQEPLRRPHVHHAGPGAALESRCAASSTPSTSSSATRTCCWSTTRSCAARPRRRSSTWRAKPARSKVYFASAAPPVRFPNVYGIDMPAASELVASSRTDDGSRAAHRRRLADLPGSRRPHPGLRARSFQHQGIRHLVFLGRTTSPATSRPSTSRACSPNDPDMAKASRRDGDKADLKIVKI